MITIKMEYIGIHNTQKTKDWIPQTSLIWSVTFLFPEVSSKGNNSNWHRPPLRASVPLCVCASVRPSRIGFRMITCERKFGLKLLVECICILYLYRTSSIMTIFRQFLSEFCLYFVIFWFPVITWERKVRCAVCLFDTFYWSYYRIISIFELTK